MLLNQFTAESNRSTKKAVGTAIIRGFAGVSAGREREGRGRFLRGLVVGRVAAVRAAGAAFLGAGAERFVDDGLDGARAPAAFGAAAKATVNLFGIPRQVRGCADGTPDIVVTQNVAGTDNHETVRTSVMRPHRYLRARRDAKGKAPFSSNSKLMPGKYWNESKQASLR
jgi:hypothetical protein